MRRRARTRIVGATAFVVSIAGSLGGCSNLDASRSTLPPATTSPATTSSSTSTTSTSSTTTTTIDDRIPTADEQALVQAFADRADALMASKDVHAVAIAIARRGSVIGDIVRGSTPSGAALTTDSRFRIASISKVPLAIVVMQLVDEDSLHLDRPFAEQWRDLPRVNDPRVRTITVRQLLQHTSGFSNLRGIFFGGGGTDWRSAAIASVGSTLDTDPGTKYRYSNANFVILATLVEQITGLPFDEAIRRRVFEPLGITSAQLTGTRVTDRTGPAYAVDASRNYMEVLGPAGAWCMTAADTARILAALQPGASTLVPADLLAQMRTPMPVPSIDEDWTYGLGLLLFHDSFGHTGTLEDVMAFAIDLPNGYTVAVLTATEEFDDGEAVKGAFQAEIDALAAVS